MTLTARKRRRLELEDAVEGVLSGDRALLARTITLIESTRAADQALAQEVLTRLLPHTGRAQRIGISGVPGVGKSTFIETLGTHLLERGRRVAVLAIDPSSALSGGSILGDKTRMERLAADPRAFIRPSPTAGSLGGVARKTREAGLLCEAAGYDVVLVETVGVGQSEHLVADMVDVFLLLMLAGAGDGLQGIKRGILELADVVAINKADGDNLLPAQRAAAEYRQALRYLHPSHGHDGQQLWQPPVLTVSSLGGEGLPEVWDQVQACRSWRAERGELETRRQQQRVRWMWSLLEEELLATLRRDPQVRGVLPALEADVAAGQLAPGLAAARILKQFKQESTS